MTSQSIPVATSLASGANATRPMRSVRSMVLPTGVDPDRAASIASIIGPQRLDREALREQEVMGRYPPKQRSARSGAWSSVRQPSFATHWGSLIEAPSLSEARSSKSCSISW